MVEHSFFEYNTAVSVAQWPCGSTTRLTLVGILFEYHMFVCVCVCVCLRRAVPGGLPADRAGQGLGSGSLGMTLATRGLRRFTRGLGLGLGLGFEPGTSMSSGT